MSESDLRNLLTQLHARLGNAQAKALTKGDSPQQPGAPALESFAVKFEADHPALAETLRRVVDALAKAGI